MKRIKQMMAEIGAEIAASRFVRVVANGGRIRVRTEARRTKRRMKYRGISRDAEKLGCSRVHLWLVLTGRRKGGPLMARYNAMKGAV